MVQYDKNIQFSKLRKTFRNNVENENKQWIFVPVITVLKNQT